MVTFGVGASFRTTNRLFGYMGEIPTEIPRKATLKVLRREGELVLVQNGAANVVVTVEDLLQNAR